MILAHAHFEEKCLIFLDINFSPSFFFFTSFPNFLEFFVLK
jgi:hypothetical protein